MIILIGPQIFAWLHNKFIYGSLAYFCLTLLVVLSLPIVRTTYYEAFYALHVLLVPLTLAMSAFHFPRIGWWLWISLGIWAGERLWRLTRVGWINGYFISSHTNRLRKVNQALELQNRKRDQHRSSNHYSTYSEQFDISMYAEPGIALLPEPQVHISNTMPISNDTIPPGYACACLLPGRTIRLRIATHRPISWSPGQHVLLRMSTISKFTTHPFTVASIYNNTPQGRIEAPNQVVELLIRAKSGFTRDLWNEVHRLSSISHGQIPFQPTIGALLKAELDGPFGSVSRTRWGNYSTMIIICGGSGVSFGVSVLEFLCQCMIGQNPSSLGSRPGGLGYSHFRTRRIRFIWLVREYGMTIFLHTLCNILIDSSAHIQWCAAKLYRCVKMLPTDSLQLDIFVTRISQATRYRQDGSALRDDVLEPPTPSFARSHRKRESWSSAVSVDSEDEHGDPISARSSVFSITDEADLHPLDLTNFDGDDDSFMPGEAQFSYQVHRTGHLRRRETRRVSKMTQAKTIRPVQDPPHEVPILPYGEGSMSKTVLSEEFDPYQCFNKIEKLPSPHHVFSPDVETRTPHSSKPLMERFQDIRTKAPVFQLESEDARALSVISEIARSGKPRLDSILREEVENAVGCIGVACEQLSTVGDRG